MKKLLAFLLALMLLVSLCACGSNGESEEKDPQAEKYEEACDLYDEGEYAEAKELFEELGISTDETTLKKLFRIKRKNSLLDVWVTTCDLKTEDLVLQKSEVDRTKWVTKSELCDMICELM